MKMVAHYDDYNEDFRVDLWEEGKGFILHLDHEYDHVLDYAQREALELDFVPLGDHTSM